MQDSKAEVAAPTPSEPTAIQASLQSESTGHDKGETPFMAKQMAETSSLTHESQVQAAPQ